MVWEARQEGVEAEKSGGQARNFSTSLPCLHNQANAPLSGVPGADTYHQLYRPRVVAVLAEKRCRW